MYFASARIGPPLNRGSIVALKSFETENNAAFPLPFRGFVIKTLPFYWNFTVLSFSLRPCPHVFGSEFWIRNIFFLDSKISPTTRYRIRCGFIIFHSESGCELSGFVGCVWTEGVSGKEKLRIQNFPDMCGRGSNSLASARVWNTDSPLPLIDYTWK